MSRGVFVMVDLKSGLAVSVDEDTMNIENDIPPKYWPEHYRVYPTAEHAILAVISRGL